MPGMDADRTTTQHGPDKRRVTVAEAAEILGITAEAVRTRIKRRKLESVKQPPGPGGTVYVLLDVDPTRPNIDPTSQGQGQTTDQTQDRGELVGALREQVAYLQGVIATRDRELEQRAEEIRRRDLALEREQQLTAMFATRLGELEAPREEPAPEAREARESPAPTQDPTPAPGGSQAATEAREAGGERRPWWRRVFGS
jgi:hypothetical protein